MTDPITVFLPAAGLGERLRPITEHIPKPLLPVLGRPLIELVLERVAPIAGRVGINLHYKPETIRRWAENSPYRERITFFPEDPVLGTGGALKNATAFLSGGPFLVHNSDTLLDTDLRRLIEHHLSSGNIATLVTHHHPALNCVVVDEKNHVVDVERPGGAGVLPVRGARRVAYTGVAVYAPEFLTFLPDGVSHVTVAWLAAAAAGHTVEALDVTGSAWNDFGTPGTYAAGIVEALTLEGETVYCSPFAGCGAIELDGYVVLEAGSDVAAGSRIRNAIVMPGGRVSGSHENRIIGPDYRIDLTEREMQPPRQAAQGKRVSLSDPLFAGRFGQPDETAEALLIGFGGSDRRYFRVRIGGESAVLMECRLDDADFHRHMAYTSFFSSHGIPVPELLAADEAGKRALFEDLGDTSLYACLKLPQDGDRVRGLYRRMVEILAALHARLHRHIDECPLLGERVFDYEHLRWESDYFLQWFVTGLRGVGVREEATLTEEFHRLASTVHAFPKTVVHRDFQSQNIMVTGGHVPRVIDYQAARMGPPAYDVASILWDPYHRLDDLLREKLLDYYIEGRRSEDESFSDDHFRGTLLACRLQRHMQALGAYAFLSEKKGKKHFLKHAGEGLRLLKEEAVEAQEDFPALGELLGRL
jgi:aminoglycoside/choline kinase family phosphotransferase/NDP-sugar pyrophosphorylase family protein